MGKKRRILFAILALAILGALAWVILNPRAEPEPVYRGHSLSAWLEHIDPIYTNRTLPQLGAAQTAIKSMGTNAIPTMLRMLRTPDSPWKNRLFALAQKQHVIKIHYTEPWRLYARAGFGFNALGPRAASAVPELLKIYEQNPPARLSIANIIKIVAGPDSKAAVPSLLRGATSTNDDTMRRVSIVALAEIHAEPNVTIPILINGLQDPEPGVRASAATGLGSFGADAKAAVPALVKFIESIAPPTTTDNVWWLDVEETAMQSLQQIDPDTAAKLSTNLNRDAK